MCVQLLLYYEQGIAKRYFARFRLVYQMMVFVASTNSSKLLAKCKPANQSKMYTANAQIKQQGSAGLKVCHLLGDESALAGVE